MKFLSILLSIILLISFAGCKNGNSASENGDSDTSIVRNTDPNAIDFASYEMTLVNRWLELDENFEADLIQIDEEFCSGELYFDSTAIIELQRMCRDAIGAGMNLKIISAWSDAPLPGTDEHQLGLAVDFNVADDSFKDTREYFWLTENCKYYGFILRFTEEKTEKTGHPAEPYHFRFVGVDNAKMIEASGLCLEEFVEKYDGFQ